MQNEAVADEETPLLMIERGQKPPQQYTDDVASSFASEVSRPLLRRMSQSWTDYNTILEKHPVLVKGVTGFILLSLGDLSGQGVEHLRPGPTAYVGVDWPRVARFGIFGLFGAPWSHYYFDYLDTCLPPTQEPFTKTTAVKVFIDQFIQAPILLALMISSLGIMKGTGIDGVQKDMEDNYVDTLIANCKCCSTTPLNLGVAVQANFLLTSVSFFDILSPGKLWLPASLVNIAFVKPTLRVLYVNVVFFFWTIILSIMLNSSN
jgi:hypothetical protein